MAPEDLDYFLDGIRDLSGYLTALRVNYTGTDVLDEYIYKLKDITTDPVDFIGMLVELRKTLAIIIMREDATSAEVLPAVKVIDEIMRMVRLEV